VTEEAGHTLSDKVSDRERWEAEQRRAERELALKERELALKEREAQRQNRGEAWKSPLVLAILTAALAAGGNATLSYLGARQQHGLETLKAEGARILEMIKTDDTEQAARNLAFLVDTGLVENQQIRDKLGAFLKTRTPENSPSLPSPSSSSSSSSSSGPAFLSQREKAELLGGPAVIPSSDPDGRVAPDDPWIQANIIEIDIPQLRKIGDGKLDGLIKFHKTAAPALIGAFAEIEKEGLLGDIRTFDGSFVPRTIRASLVLSPHALGIAIDFNARWNWLGQPPAAPGQAGSLHRIAPIFEKHGFAWGGRSTPRPDPTHFEFIDRTALQRAR
jgi:hypothetical protein